MNLTVPHFVVLGPLALLVFEVPVLVVTVSVIDLALVVSVIHLSAVFELLHHDFQLPLHTIVGQGEWGRRHLAGGNEPEIFTEQVNRIAVLIHHLEVSLNAGHACVIVGLDVESEGLVLGGSVPQEGDIL